MNQYALPDVRDAFQQKEVEVTATSGTLWTGVLNRLDSYGIWLKDSKQMHYIAWESIEGISCPPEEKEAS